MIRRLVPPLLGAALLLGLATMPALSRPAAEDKELGDVPSDLALVPRDASFFISLRYADLLASPAGKALHSMHGLHADFFKSVLRLTPEQIERVTVFQRRPGHEPIYIIRTLKPYDAKAIRIVSSLSEESKIHGKTIHWGRGWGAVHALWEVDAKTLVFGRVEVVVPYLATLEKPGKTHPFADELAIAGGKHTATAAVRPSLMARMEETEMKRFDDGLEKAIEKLKEELEKAKKEGKKSEERPREERPGGDSKPKLEDIKEEPLKLRTLDEAFERMDRFGAFSAFFRPALRCERAHAALDVGETIKLSGKAHFGSEAEAKDGETLAKAGLVLGREAIPSLFRSGPIDAKAKAIADAIKAGQEAMRGAVVERDGKTLTATLSGSIDTKALAAYVTEQVPVAKQANNLKQIGIAIHNYHDVMGHLPADIVDKDGKKLLSWRVQLLPYLEQEALYKSLDLTQAWDSERNARLLARVPDIFAPVKGKAGEWGLTYLQMPTGPGTVWTDRPGKRNFAMIARDGLSNTIAVVEASKAVPWAKPDDFAVTEKELPKFGGQFDKWFHVLMYDGAVRKVRADFDKDEMRLFINPRSARAKDFTKLELAK